MLFGLKREECLVVCNNMNEPGGHQAKWNKSDRCCMISPVCGILDIHAKKWTHRN